MRRNKMDRFKGNLNRNHGKLLLAFRFNGREYEVRCTDHSLERFTDRNLNVDEALGAIVALGKKRLDDFAVKSDDVAIIDKINKQSVIITFESEGNYTQIRIATIIGRANVVVKDGTKVFDLNWLGLRGGSK
jgi:hypothetical protein